MVHRRPNDFSNVLDTMNEIEVAMEFDTDAKIRSKTPGISAK